MGSASLIKAYEEETNGRAPLRSAPRHAILPVPVQVLMMPVGFDPAAIRSEFTRKSRISWDRCRSIPIAPEAMVTTGIRREIGGVDRINFYERATLDAFECT